MLDCAEKLNQYIIYDTPLYHRNINPDAFYILDVKGKYKPLLAKFDCTKKRRIVRFLYFKMLNDEPQNRSEISDLLNSL